MDELRIMTILNQHQKAIEDLKEAVQLLKNIVDKELSTDTSEQSSDG